MTKIILIGSGGLSAALASLQSPNGAAEPAEAHSATAMCQGLRDVREERTVADYEMGQVNALFADIFGDGQSLEDYEAEMEAEDAAAEEQMAFARAYDALLRMLDVFSQVSGVPVTTDQRIAMALLLFNDGTAEDFATAAEDLIGSGLFE